MYNIICYYSICSRFAVINRWTKWRDFGARPQHYCTLLNGRMVIVVTALISSMYDHISLRRVILKNIYTHGSCRTSQRVLIITSTHELRIIVRCALCVFIPFCCYKNIVSNRAPRSWRKTLYKIGRYIHNTHGLWRLYTIIPTFSFWNVDAYNLRRTKYFCDFCELKTWYVGITIFFKYCTNVQQFVRSCYIPTLYNITI